MKKAIGLQEPGMMDKLRDKFGPTATAAAEKAQELLSGTSLDDMSHKVPPLLSFSYDCM